VTREHWKTVFLAVIAAVLVFIDILPMRTVSIRVDLPPEAGSAPPAQVGSAMEAAVMWVSAAVLIVTIALIVWVIRRCIRHVASAKRPNPADVF
jgi:hypothetical protein